jgi:hypothetical protein
MISSGACESTYGRKQVNGICSDPPINIECPVELQKKDLAIIEKISELKEVERECININVRENELFSIASTLKNIMSKEGMDGSNITLYVGVFLFVVAIILYVSWLQ